MELSIMNDLFAQYSMYAAWLAIAYLAIAFGFEIRNRFRKAQRDRLVDSLNRSLGSQFSDSAALASEMVVGDMEYFTQAQFAGDGEFERKLQNDLQSLAILSIIDDAVIARTALSLKGRLRNSEDRSRWLGFINAWVQRHEMPPFGKLMSDEARRGIHEYAKKKRMLVRELEAV
jgi:hypothetical protein